MAGKHVTLMVIPDDQTNPRRLRLALWQYRGALIFISIMVIAPIIYVIFYHQIISRAAKAGRLEEENAALRLYQYKVQVLEQSLQETRQLMAQVATMAGLDSILFADWRTVEDTTSGQSGRKRVPATKRNFSPTSSIPDGLPATGWITQGFSGAAGSRHSGIDLALHEGSDVYSTAFGVVKFAGDDEIFGRMVVVANNDSIETLYGHNSKLLVQKGDTVFAGQRIALSGNTGLSSAPHLHYEIKIRGKAVNPINYFMESHETN